MTHKEEVIEMLNILKESCENSIGNRITKNQKFTILSKISPDSFRFVIDESIKEINENREV